PRSRRRRRGCWRDQARLVLTRIALCGYARAAVGELHEAPPRAQLALLTTARARSCSGTPSRPSERRRAWTCLVAAFRRLAPHGRKRSERAQERQCQPPSQLGHAPSVAMLRARVS